MSEEKKIAVTEEVKEARKLSMEELEQVTGGSDSDESGTDNPLLVSDKIYR